MQQLNFEFVEKLDLVSDKGAAWKPPVIVRENPEKQKDDFQTPEAIAEYMVNLLPTDIFNVLEPTPGKGNIVHVLQDRGYNITAPADWWKLDKTLKFDAVVCNLPFSSRSFYNCPAEYAGKGMTVMYDQLNILMGMADRIIALVPWFTIIDSDVRTRAFMEYGLISVTALPRKVFNFSRIQTCILELGRGYPGYAQFKYLKF